MRLGQVSDYLSKNSCIFVFYWINWIELFIIYIVQFWSKIIHVISNQTRTLRSFDFKITGMTSIKFYSSKFNNYYKLCLAI